MMFDKIVEEKIKEIEQDQAEVSLKDFITCAYY